MLTALKNRATFALKNGPPSSQHFFATNALHPAAEGICGEKMFPGTLGAGPRESAKVASFESAVDIFDLGMPESWSIPSWTSPVGENDRHLDVENAETDLGERRFPAQRNKEEEPG